MNKTQERVFNTILKFWPFLSRLGGSLIVTVPTSIVISSILQELGDPAKPIVTTPGLFVNAFATVSFCFIVALLGGPERIIDFGGKLLNYLLFWVDLESSFAELAEKHGTKKAEHIYQENLTGRRGAGRILLILLAFSVDYFFFTVTRSRGFALGTGVAFWIDSWFVAEELGYMHLVSRVLLPIRREAVHLFQLAGKAGSAVASAITFPYRYVKTLIENRKKAQAEETSEKQESNNTEPETVATEAVETENESTENQDETVDNESETTAQ